MLATGTTLGHCTKLAPLGAVGLGEVDRTRAGAPYVVMELLKGESLREALKSGPLPSRQAIDCAAQGAWDLAAAHAKRILLLSSIVVEFHSRLWP